MFRFCIVLTLGLLASVSAAPSMGADAVSVDVAIKKGLADVRIRGLGGSTGDSIQIDVTRKVGREVRIEVSPGTVFKSADGTAQNMAAAGVKWERIGEGPWRKTNVMVLSDARPRTYVVEAYCLDFEKPNPKQANAFSLDVLDGKTTRLLIQAQKSGATPKVVQTAVWIDRAGVEVDVLRRRFPVSDDEVKAAKALLVAVNVKAGGTKTDVSVQLDELLAELRKQAAQRRAQGIGRGDTVNVAGGGAELRRLARVVAKLDAGSELSVLRAVGQKIHVSATVAGETQRGWVDASQLILPEGKTAGPRPPAVELPEGLRQLGENLDIFGKEEK